MGSSFIKYRGCGFWSQDQFIEEWLRNLSKIARSYAKDEPWLQEACAHWELMSSGDFNGCIDVKLNSFITDKFRCDMLIEISKSLQSTLTQKSALFETGELFIGLLQGELRTDASSSIDYFGR